MSWKRRARAAIAAGDNRIFVASLDEVRSESATSAEDLELFYGSCGIAGVHLQAELDGLCVAERHYRSLAKQPDSLSEDLNLEMLERLLALFLGQVLIHTLDGKWSVYKGRYHSCSPIVIRLPSNRHLDVFGFCKDLALKTQLNGASKSEALLRCVRSADKIAFP